MSEAEIKAVKDAGYNDNRFNQYISDRTSLVRATLLMRFLAAPEIPCLCWCDAFTPGAATRPDGILPRRSDPRLTHQAAALWLPGCSTETSMIPGTRSA